MTEEQQKAVDTVDRAIIISANAGSGKTSTMVTRLVSIITNKLASVEEILALTFTRSAATEMKQRLSSKLQELLLDENNDKKFIENQINELNVADISSLDSFCQKVIKKYFYTIDVDPNFAIIDEVEAGYLKATALESVLLDYAPLEEFQTLSQILKDTKKFDNISSLILELSEFMFSLVDIEDYIKKVTNKTKIYNEVVKYTLNRFKRFIEHYKVTFLEYHKEIEFNNYELLRDNCNLMCDFCNLFQTFTLDQMSNLASYPNFLPFSRAKKGREPEELDLQEKISADVNEFKKEIVEYLNVFCYGNIVEMSKHYEDSFTFVELVCKLTYDFITKYKELKEQRNVLDFTDLEDKAIKILSNQTVQDEVKKQYKFICVDEFQDTNEKQSALLNYICSEDNTFFVGDPKQSIYNFRQCDLNIFVRLIDEFKLDKSKLALSFNQNFRSHKHILEFVNQVFDKIMLKNVSNIDYKNENQFKNLKVLKFKYKGKIEKTRKVNYIERVKVFKLEKDCKGLVFENYVLKTNKKLNQARKLKFNLRFNSKSNVYSVVKEQTKKLSYEETNEGMVAVSYILDFFNKKMQIIDPQTKKKRRVKFSDFVILLRSRTDFDVYIDALNRYNIPVSAKFKLNLVELPHIMQIINCVKAISNPRQDLPLVASLKVVGKFSEEELFTIRENYKDGFYFESLENYDKQDNIFEKIKIYKEKMNNYRIFARNFSVSELIIKLIKECNVENELLKEENGVDMVSQLQLFISKLENKSFNDSCDEFLQFIENYKKAFQVDFSTVSSDNCVKITTIHDSKGLEFPITIIGGCGKAFNLSKQTDFVFTKELGVGCVDTDLSKRVKYGTIAQNAIFNQKQTDEILEEMRILYVALTRPKEYLALIGEYSKEKNEKIDDYSIMKCRSFYDFIMLGEKFN